MSGRAHRRQSASAARVARSALFFDVFKLRIGLVIAVTAVMGAAATPGVSLPLVAGIALFVGVTLAAAAAGGFNQFVERDIDARMTRTRHRAFVTGRLPTSRRGCSGLPPWRPAACCSSGRHQCRGGGAHLPRRVHLRRGVHRLAQAHHGVEHRGRRSRRAASRAGGRDGGAPEGHRRAADGVRGGAVPVDAAALLEPRDRVPRRLRSGRRPDAAREGRERAGGAGGACERGRPRCGVHRAGGLRHVRHLSRRCAPRRLAIPVDELHARAAGHARDNAMRNFHMSLAQLTCVLVAAFADAAWYG